MTEKKLNLTTITQQRKLLPSKKSSSENNFDEFQKKIKRDKKIERS